VLERRRRIGVSEINLAIVGAASLRCGAPILGALAGYYGERPLRVALYDADEERLDLFERFARVAFTVARSAHELCALTDPKEALFEADRVVIALDANCALKRLKQERIELAKAKSEEDLLAKALESILEGLPPRVETLSLLPDGSPVPRSKYRQMNWPAVPSEAECKALPHQIMRWIRTEDYLHEFLAQHERSPFKAWLEDVRTATLVRAK
jgi:hypothetical protein